MPHPHTLPPSSSTQAEIERLRSKPVSLELDPTPTYLPVTPDPELPLLNTGNCWPFRHDHQTGRVFSQFMEAGSKAEHPTQFYIEYPTGSGHFHAIDADVMARSILTVEPDPVDWSVYVVARWLDQIPNGVRILGLFDSAKA